MDLNLFESFVEVAKEMSFTQAAKNLNITQSTMSLRIQKLENDIGVPLFMRLNREIRLTHYGKILLPYAQQCVEIKNSGFQRLEEEKGIMNSRLRMTAVMPFDILIMPRLLPALKTYIPNVDIHLIKHTGSSSDMMKMVLDYELDFAFIYNTGSFQEEINAHDNGIRCMPLYAEDIVLLAGASHDPQLQAPLELSDLTSRQFVFLDRRTVLSRHLQTYFEQQHVQFNSGLYINNIIGILEILRQSDMLAFLPKCSVYREIQSGELIELPLAVPPEPIMTDLVYLQHDLAMHASKFVKKQVIQITKELNVPCRIIPGNR